MRQVMVASLGGLLLVAGAGCGGNNNNGPACTTTNTPCGGDIVGTWSYQEVCGVSNTFMDSACPTAVYDLTPTASGSYVFNADMTFSLNLTTGETGTITFPASCVGKSACSSLDQTISQGGMTATLSCTGGTGQACTCTGSETEAFNETGTYKIEGTNVVMTDSKGGVGASAFCVQGSQLTVFATDDSVSSSSDGGTTTTTTVNDGEYIVFTKP
jgi:hypothetical protein